MLITTLEYDDYKGQIGVGRLRSGTLHKGMTVVRITPKGEQSTAKIQYLFTYHNLHRLEVALDRIVCITLRRHVGRSQPYPDGRGP